MPGQTHDPSRRQLLLYSATSIAALGAIACGKSPPSSCNPTNLSGDDLGVRKTLEYVDRTPDPAKPCVKCVQYVAPPSADQCGACKVMKGPVHPKGYCRVFAPLA